MVPSSPAHLTVLLTCRELVLRAGTQLYTRDVAEALRALGHVPIVYAPRLGPAAEELRRSGISVVGDLERLVEAPDVIHGQHHVEAMAAMLRFPRTPALFVCHGWLPWPEAPPRFPTLSLYVAVDALRRERLVIEHGIDPRVVRVLHNFVDLERFLPRPPLPARPRRALVFSNQVGAEGALMAAAREACAGAGIELAAVGLGFGRPVEAPEELLPGFDLVFARGRCALEAMAVGAAVVLADAEGLGQLVTSESFERLQDLNFGFQALARAPDGQALAAEVARFDAADAARVSARVRREHDRRTAVPALVGFYREAILAVERERSRATAPGADDELLRAASRYLTWASEQIDLQIAFARDAALAQRSLTELAGEAAAAASTELIAARAELGEVRAALARTTEESTALAMRAGSAEADLTLLASSPFVRLRNRLLSVAPLVAAYQRLKSSS